MLCAVSDSEAGILEVAGEPPGGEPMSTPAVTVFRV
jgi:hypothetical protein